MTRRKLRQWLARSSSGTTHLARAVAEDVLGGLVPVANDPLAVRRNDRMRASRERGLGDGLFAC